jgi:hypothetical protein
VNPPLHQIVLWLFVLNLGIAFGAGCYETRVTVPQWFQPANLGTPQWNPRAARAANVGLRFWAYVTTGPLTLLTFASLLLVSNAPFEARGAWWLAIAATLLDRVMTFAYFVPTMIALTRDDTQNAMQTARASRWVNLGSIRLTATLVAWIAALVALVNTRGA